MIYFISRHAGAVAWAAEQGLQVDELISHLDAARIERLQQGDTIIGTLPVHLAAEVCARGARYLHLTLDLPPELRGKELTAADMSACHARLQEYRVSEA